MSYESGPFPAEEFPTGGSDTRDSKKKKKSESGSSAGVAAERTTDEAPEGVEKAKPARDLAQLFKEVVETPAGGKSGEKPKEAKQEQPADETPAEEEPETTKAAVEATDDSSEDLAADTTIKSEEQPVVAEMLIDPRVETIKAEQVEPSSTQAVANDAAVEMLETTKQLTVEGVPLTEATAEAFAQTMGEPAPEIPGEEALEETEPLASETDAKDEEDDRSTAPARSAARGAGGGGFGRWGGGAATPYAAMGPGGYGGAPAAANMAPGSAAPVYEVSGVASGLLIGGIVGYLLGRRRGRIKTERRLLPVQQNLEREVRALHDHLAIREAQVRQLVYERAATETKAVAEVAAIAPAQPVTRLEKISPLAKPEAIKHTPEAVLKKELGTKDVLRIAESIIVGAATIRQVFETNLITETGLRSIVAEHLRGGDVHKVLREALTEKEKTYERDPFLARIAEEQQVAAAGGGTQAAGVPFAGAADEATGFEHNEAVEAQRTATLHTSEAQQATRPLVIANVVALAVLAGLVFVLLFLWLTR